MKMIRHFLSIIHKMNFLAFYLNRKHIAILISLFCLLHDMSLSIYSVEYMQLLLSFILVAIISYFCFYVYGYNVFHYLKHYWNFKCTKIHFCRIIQGTNVQDIIYNNYLEKSNFSKLMVIFLIFNKRDRTVWFSSKLIW